jgi:hypothetical protein
MKSLVISLGFFALLGAGETYAETVTFDAPTLCITYCSGFTTSDPAVSLDYISYGLTSLSVNGKIYADPNVRADAVLVQTVVNTLYKKIFIRQLTDEPYTSVDGSVVFLTTTYQETHTYTSSGRAHAWITKYYELGGSLTLP